MAGWRATGRPDDLMKEQPQLLETAASWRADIMMGQDSCGEGVGDDSLHANDFRPFGFSL